MRMLSNTKDKSEGDKTDDQEAQVLGSLVGHMPPGQGELGAGKDVNQEKEYQVYVQLSVHPPSQ
jgi:hypothetical protein